MRTLVILSLTLFSLGCGGRTHIGAPAREDGGPVTQKDSTPPVSCKAPAKISSLEPLLDALNKLTWQSYGRYSSTVLKITDDLQVTAPLEVNAKQVKVPASCASYGCRPQVSFVLTKKLAGVTCLQHEQPAWFLGCTRLSIAAGARARFQAAIVDTHPGTYNYMPVIYVHPECNTPCSGADFLCPANNICFPGFDEFCRLCQARDKTVCACHTAKGPMADGAQCHYATSGDTSKGGTCKAGACE